MISSTRQEVASDMSSFFHAFFSLQIPVKIVLDHGGPVGGQIRYQPSHDLQGFEPQRSSVYSGDFQTKLG